MSKTYSAYILERQKNLELAIDVIKKIENPKISDFKFLTTEDEDDIPAGEIAKTVLLGAIGCIPTSGALISNLVSIVFMEFTKKGNDSKNELWEEFSVKILDMILDSKVNTVISQVFGIETFLNKFLGAKNAFNKSPIEEAEYCRTEYNDVEDELRKFLVQIINDSSTRSKTIAIFAMMATIHLLILKEGIMFGSKWGISNAKITELSNWYSNAFSMYTDHCLYSFEEGVEKIKSITTIDGGEKTRRYNQYKSFCAQFVFDYLTSWVGLDHVKFPNSINLEHVRYLWCGPFGIPVDNSKPLQNHPVKSEISGTYYTPSFDQINHRFNDEFYQYNLYGNQNYISSEFSVDNYWVYGHREILTNSNTFSTITGSVKAPFTNSKKIKYTTALEASTMYVEYDIQPRVLNIKGSPEAEISLGMSVGAQNIVVGPDMIPKPVIVVPTKKIECKFAHHKVARIAPYGTNKVKYPMVEPENGGFLDAVSIGFLPIEVIPKNIIHNKVATFINAQKSDMGNQDEDVVFAQDHVLPTVHSVKLPMYRELKFNVEMAPNNSTQKYAVGIRYHCTESTTFEIFSLDSVCGDLPLEPCKDYGYDKYKTKIFPQKFLYLKSPNQVITVSTSTKDIYIHSIILLPVN